MLTTQADQETVRKALGYKASDFIRKDATIAHITERLNGNLAQPVLSGGSSDRPEAAAIVRGCRKYHPDQTGPYAWSSPAKSLSGW